MLSVGTESGSECSATTLNLSFPHMTAFLGRTRDLSHADARINAGGLYDVRRGRTIWIGIRTKGTAAPGQPASNRPEPNFLTGTSYLRDSLTPSLAAKSPSPRDMLARSTWFEFQRRDGDSWDGGSDAAYASSVKHRGATAVTARARPQVIFFPHSMSP